MDEMKENRIVLGVKNQKTEFDTFGKGFIK